MLANDHRVLVNDQHVLANDQRVLANDQRVLANDQRVLANDQRVLANDQRVLANDRHVLVMLRIRREWADMCAHQIVLICEQFHDCDTIMKPTSILLLSNSIALHIIKFFCVPCLL